MDRLDVTEKFHGISFPGHVHTQESLQSAVEFEFRDTDVLITTYPKSGTTWMQQIVTLVTSKGDPGLSQTVENYFRAPWLEQYYTAAVLKASVASSSSSSSRLLTTHLPHKLMSSRLQGCNTKVIYVSRNPKDVVVSFYHFHRMANFLPDPLSFTQFLQQFLEGTVYYGSWFDHIIDWTQTASVKNLLHITYEEMSQDLRGAINKVSSFLQCPLVEEEVNSCMKHCSFKTMKDNMMVNYTLIPQEIMDHSKGSFMRKGEIGDWKNMFTEEQNQLFERVFATKMQRSSLQFVWEMPDEKEKQAGDTDPSK